MTRARHVVKYSGGTGSWAAAKRVAECHGTDDLILLFTNTLAEDTDLYRFLVEGAFNVFGRRAPVPITTYARSIPEWHEDRYGRRRMLANLRRHMAALLPELVWCTPGLDPWEVFEARRFLGNSRVDPCSQDLKRRPADRWIAQHCDPASTTLYIGIDWTEEHRFDDGAGREAKNHWAKRGWRAEAPLCEVPLISKADIGAWLDRERILVPRLNRLGFAHNNCGGFCVKAGQGHYAHLLQTWPERYAFHEAREESLRDQLGKDVSMLTDRRGDGRKKPLTLRDLRRRLEAGERIDRFEIGGCGCFLDDPNAEDTALLEELLA